MAEKTEEKIKILEFEKRLIDLEVQNEKLRSLIGDINLKELSQRVEDLEDLITVENAGIVELQKMLQEELPKTIEEKMKKIAEQRVIIPQPIMEEIEKIKAQSMLNKSEIEALKKMESSLKDSIQEPIFEKIKEIENKLSENKSAIQALSKKAEKIGDLTTEIKLLKAENKALEDQFNEYPTKIELDKKIENINKNINERLSELEDIKTKIMMNKSEIHGINEMIEKMNAKIIEFEPALKTIEVIKDLSATTEESKKLLKEARLISTKIDQFEKKVEKVSQIESLLNEISAEVKALKTESEKIKKDLLNTAPMNLVEDISKKLEEEKRMASVEAIKKIVIKLTELESRLSRLEASLSFKKYGPKAIIIE